MKNSRTYDACCRKLAQYKDEKFEINSNIFWQKKLHKFQFAD